MTQSIPRRFCSRCMKVDDNGDFRGIYRDAKYVTTYKASPFIHEFFATVELAHVF
jgi:hypothetical protein